MLGFAAAHVTPEVLRIYNEEFSLPQIAHGTRAPRSSARCSSEKRYVLRHGGEIVMDVPIDFLTGSIRDELPVRPMSERKVTDSDAPLYRRRAPSSGRCFRRVLAHRDVCSREPLYGRYDGVVRGTTVVPRGERERRRASRRCMARRSASRSASPEIRGTAGSIRRWRRSTRCSNRCAKSSRSARGRSG